MEAKTSDTLEESLSPSSQKLLGELRRLSAECDEYTLSHYKRINPFSENIINWREKGEKLLGEGSVAFDSATIIGHPVVGTDCWVGLGCLIDASGGLTIGNHCVIASGTHIYTHDTVAWALSGGIDEHYHAPVEIGDCVFIGAQCVITAGTSIGAHSLICANATVTTDVPAYSIVAGTPGRIIGHVEIVDGHVKLVYNNHADD